MNHLEEAKRLMHIERMEGRMHILDANPEASTAHALIAIAEQLELANKLQANKDYMDDLITTDTFKSIWKEGV